MSYKAVAERCLTAMLAAAGLATCVPETAPAAERSRINCGSFSVVAETIVAGGNGFFGQGLYQSMQVVPTNGAHTTKVQLRQHTSSNTASGGRPRLDSLGVFWRCTRSDFGKDFVVLTFECVNEDAKTCTIATDHPGSEWEQVYSADGVPLLANPAEILPEDELRLRRLGLWSKLFGPNAPVLGAEIYPPP